MGRIKSSEVPGTVDRGTVDRGPAHSSQGAAPRALFWDARREEKPVQGVARSPRANIAEEALEIRAQRAAIVREARGATRRSSHASP